MMFLGGLGGATSPSCPIGECGCL